jgi:hypothetical protein
MHPPSPTPTGAAQPPPATAPPTPPLNPASGGGFFYGRADGRQNLLGWLSLVSGIAGTGCCCCPRLNGAPFVGGVPAVALGILHLQKVKRGQATMAWLGWAGIILGAFALLGGVFSLTTEWTDRIKDQHNRFGGR